MLIAYFGLKHVILIKIKRIVFLDLLVFLFLNAKMA
jgi:hypothetical protein